MSDDNKNTGAGEHYQELNRRTFLGETGRVLSMALASAGVFYEFIDHIANCFDVSTEVRQHFTNSRVEFLKAIRAAIDPRIEKLSAKTEQGSRIAVE